MPSRASSAFSISCTRARGAFLLLDEVLEAVDLFLQARRRLSSARRDCGTARARDGPRSRDVAVRAKVELEKSELSQRLHERCGGRPPLLMRRRVSLVRDEKR